MTKQEKQIVEVNEIFADAVIDRELTDGAIYNDEFKGFHDDYLVLHCLIRRYQPKSIFEIGTNMGTGTKILKNACMSAVVMTLDLPTELAHESLQHPISEGKGDRVGKNCDLPFIQLRGDSMTFDFSKYPCEAYFVDGEHDELHVNHETVQILLNKPSLIVYHDADIPGVFQGIIKGFDGVKGYTLYRVMGTRILFALKNDY